MFYVFCECIPALIVLQQSQSRDISGGLINVSNRCCNDQKIIYILLHSPSSPWALSRINCRTWQQLNLKYSWTNTRKTLWVGTRQKLLQSVVSLERSDCVTAYFGAFNILNPQEGNAENHFVFFFIIVKPWARWMVDIRVETQRISFSFSFLTVCITMLCVL